MQSSARTHRITRFVIIFFLPSLSPGCVGRARPRLRLGRHLVVVVVVADAAVLQQGVSYEESLASS